MEYRKNIFPASLIFISFLRDQHHNGQMYNDFKKANIPDVMQFKFSSTRPDLSKLDSILGMISSKTSTNFDGYIEQIETELKTKNINENLSDLKVKEEEEKNANQESTFMKFTPETSAEQNLNFDVETTEKMEVKFI